MSDSEINVCALVKGDERYIVLFDDKHRTDAMRQLGAWASNYDLSYTWWDAARMAKSIRENQVNQNTASVDDAAGAAPPPVRRKPRKPGRSRKWRRGGFSGGE